MGKRQHDPDKERVFVRPITGAYSLTDELKRLRAMPRVIKGAETKLDGGPQHFSRHYVEPEDGLCQTLHIHLEEYAPGGTTQKHGHVNEAAFYILDGSGYEIHDGVRYDWKAGDVAIVHNNCVHQHFNASAREPARALVIKTKPMYLFMNMLFQHPDEMPWEMSRQGLLKHLINEQMNTRMETVDAYMQLIPPGSRSGKHRHLAEECLYVVEGIGYDLHQDCDVEITDTYEWKPQAEIKRYEWEAGDVIYVPPCTIHQHFNGDPARPARLISCTNRIYKNSGLNDLVQLEDAPEYDPKVVLTAALVREYLEGRRDKVA